MAICEFDKLDCVVGGGSIGVCVRLHVVIFQFSSFI